MQGSDGQLYRVLCELDGSESPGLDGDITDINFPPKLEEGITRTLMLLPSGPPGLVSMLLPPVQTPGSLSLSLSVFNGCWLGAMRNLWEA